VKLSELEDYDKLEVRFDRVDNRLDKIENSFNSRFNQLEARLNRVERTVWLAVAASVAQIVTALFK
jgi:tetrahydromethanopterin S-methyltransferase subunit G